MSIKDHVEGIKKELDSSICALEDAKKLLQILPAEIEARLRALIGEEKKAEKVVAATADEFVKALKELDATAKTKAVKVGDIKERLSAKINQTTMNNVAADARISSHGEKAGKRYFLK